MRYPLRAAELRSEGNRTFERDRENVLNVFPWRKLCVQIFPFFEIQNTKYGPRHLPPQV